MEPVSAAESTAILNRAIFLMAALVLRELCWEGSCGSFSKADAWRGFFGALERFRNYPLDPSEVQRLMERSEILNLRPDLVRALSHPFQGRDFSSLLTQMSDETYSKKDQEDAGYDDNNKELVPKEDNKKELVPKEVTEEVTVEDAGNVSEEDTVYEEVAEKDAGINTVVAEEEAGINAREAGINVEEFINLEEVSRNDFSVAGNNEAVARWRSEQMRLMIRMKCVKPLPFFLRKIWLNQPLMQNYWKVQTREVVKSLPRRDFHC